MKRIKSEAGSITMLVFAILTFILIILGTIFTTMIYKSKSQTVELKALMNTYDGDMEELAEERAANKGEPLSASNYSKVRAKIASNTLQEVEYKPTEVSTSVPIPGNKNGGAADQSFTQSDLNALTVKWYLLNADENNIYLVSQATNPEKKVTFQGFSGYDNYLYYLNELSTNLFVNNAKGVTTNRAHALRLSDIMEAAKAVNNWNDSDLYENFVNSAPLKSTGVTNIGDSITYGNETNSRSYPKLYGINAGTVIVNNDIYDESPTWISSNASGSGLSLPIDSYTTYTKASSLTVNGTYFSYLTNSDANERIEKQLIALGNFGKTKIAEELFNDNNEKIKYYYIASRFINAYSTVASFNVCCVTRGCLTSDNLAVSHDGTQIDSQPFRVVVSIPASHVLVASDGTVTLK